MATQVAFSDLDSWLGSQPVNTADTPYEIIVSGLVVSDIGDSTTSGTLGYIIKSNSTKYVDLSFTEIPSGVTDIDNTFSNCTSLVAPPVIPNTVTRMVLTFDNCTSLVVPPVIPNTVTSISNTFRGCTSLVNAPIIPNSVTYIGGTFKNCTSLVNAPAIPDGVFGMDETFYNCTSLVNAPVIPDSVIDLTGAFWNCTSLVNAPAIPDSVTNMMGTFRNCTSLVNAPVIPDGVMNMNYTFYNCTSLVNAPVIPDSVISMNSTFTVCRLLSHKPIIPSTVTDTHDCYSYVWTSNWKGTESQAESFLSTFFAQTTDSELQVYNNDLVTYEESIYNIDISTLSTYLAGLDPNTVSTAYKIYIRGLTSSNASDINPALVANSTKFVDLQYTTIPSGTDCDYLFEDCVTLTKSAVIDLNTTSLVMTFYGCSNLQEAPVLPSEVEELEGTFAYCSSLKEPPVIPSWITNMQNLFKGCTSLEEAPDIPSGVTNIDGTFRGCTSIESISSIPASVTIGEQAFQDCTSLRKIDEFHIPLATLKNNTDFEDMFKGCTSLESIGFKVDTDKWHAYRLKFSGSSVEGKVFGIEQGQVVSTSIQNTQISQDDIKLPVLTDELWFPDSIMTDSEVEDVVEDVLNNRYTYWKKTVIDPSSKSLVMMASDPDNVVSNFLGNGEGIDVEVINNSKSITLNNDKRLIADGSGITVTLNYNSKVGAVTEIYAMQACTITYYTGQSTTQSWSMSAGTKAVFIYYSGWKLHSNYGTTNSVAVDNMQSVSSNAVYNAMNSQKIMVKDTKIGSFTLNSGQTVSPNISSYVHTPPQGYGRLCSLYSLGQNYFQLSMNFVGNVAYATITNTYTGTLTTDVYLYEIFMPNNILPT